MVEFFKEFWEFLRERKKNWLNEKTVLMIAFLKEFWEFLRERKKYWLFPIIIY